MRTIATVLATLAAAAAATLAAGCSASMPDCNDDWVEDYLIKWFKDDDSTGVFEVLTGAGYADRAATFRNQEFSIVGARTVSREAGVNSATCEAWIHGRKLTGTELGQAVEALAGVSYEVYLTDDGEPYVKLIEMELN